MKYLILGSGGVGSYYGAMLLNAQHPVSFVARGAHLAAIQKNGLRLKHNETLFHRPVEAKTLSAFSDTEILAFDAILLTAKSTATPKIAQQLQQIIGEQTPPFIISLQNGVENEEILCQFFAHDKIIGGLSRKIGAHIIAPGIIESTGTVETIIGAILHNQTNHLFLQKLQQEFIAANINCETSNNIQLELWKKLIINNGVNAICALTQTTTGTLFKNEKLTFLVYQLMQETARAAKAKNILIQQNDVDAMFALIQKFDSIKPSMLVDREQRRKPEIDEICGIVIRCLQSQGLDAPYTRSISFLLEYAIQNES